MSTEVGAVLEGRVTGITKFGAFIALPDGKSGLVHISEIANSYVTDVHDHVHEGDTVKVRVLEIGDNGKISLSIKRAMEDARPAPRPPREGFGGRQEQFSRPPRESFGARPEQPPRPPRYAPSRQERPAQSGDTGFEDRLKQFMQESDSKNSGNRFFEKKPVSRRKK